MRGKEKEREREIVRLDINTCMCIFIITLQIDILCAMYRCTVYMNTCTIRLEDNLSEVSCLTQVFLPAKN